VSANGLIIKNYHVGPDYIETPDSLSVRYVDRSGSTGYLEVLDFDVVSDIALLTNPHPADDYSTYSEAIPSRGDIAYALGNPGDWGIVLVPGPTNGYVEHSYAKTAPVKCMSAVF
jgi:hypothetical protein